MRYVSLLQGGAFQIVAGWWGHQPGQPAVVGVLTDHSFDNGATNGIASFQAGLTF